RQGLHRVGHRLSLSCRVHRSDRCCLCATGHTASDQVIEGEDGVGLRPQADWVGARARVPMLQEAHVIARRLDGPPHHYHADRTPLPERGPTIPRETSSLPTIGVHGTATATSVYDADGATMTVMAFSTARWTRAR